MAYKKSIVPGTTKKPSAADTLYGSAKKSVNPQIQKKKRKGKGFMAQMDRIARLIRQNPSSQLTTDISMMGKSRYPGE